MDEMLTRLEIKRKLEPWLVEGLPADEIVKGVLVALEDSTKLTRPIEKGILGDRAIYAWRSEDVPVVEPALRLLGELLAGGFVSPKALGVGIAELVTFLVRLRRERARVEDPKHIAVLLRLREGPSGGLSVTSLAEQLAELPDSPFEGRSDVERILEELATPAAGERPHALVERRGMLWRALV